MKKNHLIFQKVILISYSSKYLLRGEVNYMEKKTKKGEAGQMFQMLMTLIVVGMIMLLGFQLIGNVFRTSSQIDYIQFRRVLISSIDTVASDYNARQRIELDVPRGAEEICFVDMTKSGTTGNPLIDSYWTDSAYRNNNDKSLVRNVFIMGNSFVASFRVENLDLDQRFLCIPARRGKVEFWAIGVGRSFSVERVY